MPIQELQSRMSSREFEVWRVMDRRGELPDDWDQVGVLAATVANFAGFGRPENPASAADFRPKWKNLGEDEAKQVKVFEQMTKRPDYSEFIWKT